MPLPANADARALAAMADALPSLIFFIAPDGGLSWVNARFAEFTGRSPENLLGFRWHEVVHPDDLDDVSAHFKRPHAGAPFTGEWRLLSRDGDWRWFVLRTTRMVAEDGVVTDAIGDAADIHAQKRQQVELAAALEAKQALLHEVSHRVKNSLQLITALLSLQAAQTREESARQSVIAARNRVAVVAGVHRRLYWEEGNDSIDLVTYLPGLIEETLADHRTGATQVRVDAPEPVVMRLSSAVPLALILSELVANAVRHGIRDGAGTVELSLRGGETIVATVSDDGAGLPDGFNPRSAGLGMRIVTALSRQARATFSIVPQERGACFRVELPAA